LKRLQAWVVARPAVRDMSEAAGTPPAASVLATRIIPGARPRGACSSRRCLCRPGEPGRRPCHPTRKCASKGVSASTPHPARHGLDRQAVLGRSRIRELGRRDLGAAGRSFWATSPCEGRERSISTSEDSSPRAAFRGGHRSTSPGETWRCSPRSVPVTGQPPFGTNSGRLRPGFPAGTAG